MDDEKDKEDASRAPSRAVEHLNAAMVVTGITVAPGNPLMARIYDKTAELKLSGREEKRVIEHALWSSNGWDGVQPVTRVEFQHRGVFLDEVDLRDPEDLEKQLDAVWQHDAKWLRLVDPSTASRLSRCKLDPRWEAVVGTEFRHRAAPVIRVRNRGGAKPELVLGAAMSRLASIGRMAPIDLGVNEDGEPRDEQEFVEAMSNAEAESWCRERIVDVLNVATPDVVVSLLNKWGPKEATKRLVIKQNAVIARFSSVDDSRSVQREGR